MLPFYGKIHIAYIPTKKSIWNIKANNLVEKYARRLHLQKKIYKRQRHLMKMITLV